jgi:hypothetical protein
MEINLAGQAEVFGSARRKTWAPEPPPGAGSLHSTASYTATALRRPLEDSTKLLLLLDSVDFI